MFPSERSQAGEPTYGMIATLRSSGKEEAQEESHITSSHQTALPRGVEVGSNRCTEPP